MFARRLLSSAFLVVLLISAIVGASLYVAATRWRSPAAKEVLVAPGMSMRAIARNLYEEEIIGMPTFFELWARMKGLDRKLRAGSYVFKAGVTMEEVLGKLERGEVKQYALTIIEGWTIRDIVAALKGKPFLQDDQMPARFQKLASDKALMTSLGFPGAPSLEGYLFPDTYLLAKPLTAQQLIRRLVKRFGDVWREVGGDAVADRTGLTREEVVTLASIVEKESAVPEERPLIAGVFANRLRRGMPLQSDPTIIYGLPNFDGNIRKGDIRNPHPYNTYVHAGLPPGPICNPGKASIEAVLHPVPNPYLYFVSRNDGTHVFSRTLAEHQAAVRKYQLRR